ncbi:MAG: hypothetical protein NC517_01390 [Firmicutes bacterium]|nr:hypothetical protein [Bacillota bacterium]
MVEIWENNPVENYINNSLIPVDERELIEFDKKICDVIGVEVDEETGKLHIKYSWHEIAGIIIGEAAKYARAKKGLRINPIDNIKTGIKARRQEKVIKEFYLKYFQSRKYQNELEKECMQIEDPNKVYDVIITYLKGLKSILESDLEKVERRKGV